jgi:hypothetical protein
MVVTGGGSLFGAFRNLSAALWRQDMVNFFFESTNGKSQRSISCSRNFFIQTKGHIKLKD